MLKYPLISEDISIEQFVKMAQIIELPNYTDMENVLELVNIACEGITAATPESLTDRDLLPISVMTEEKDISIIRLWYHICLLLSYEAQERSIFFLKGEKYNFNLNSIGSTGKTITTIEFAKAMATAQ
jgi:hypothetical protein